MPATKTRALNRRSARGQHLIEVLVAVAISGFLAVAMGASLAQTINTSVMAENQVKANQLANSLLDRVKSVPYKQLPPPGTYAVSVYADDGVPNGTESFRRLYNPGSLALDGLSYWSPSAWNTEMRGPSPSRKATAEVTFAPAPTSAPNATLATVTVQWNENKALRSITISSVITDSGKHG